MRPYKELKDSIKDYYAEMKQDLQMDLMLPEEHCEHIAKRVLTDLFDEIHNWMEGREE